MLNLDGIATFNPFRYRSYYFDTETSLYYLQTRYYDPELGRFISADSIEYLDPETLGGLNLYAYCGNNPVMAVDDTGSESVPWWQWLISGLSVVAGAILCFVPGGQGLGVALLTSGTSSLISNIMTAAGVEGKTASIISSVLNIITGIALCFTPFAGLGASMIGSGAGGIVGGFISEAFGGSFEIGAMVGSIVGGIIGGKVHDAIKFSKIAEKGILIGKMGQFETEAMSRGLEYYKGMPGYSILSKVAPKLTAKLGWAHNYHYIRNVMKYNGMIYNLGGPKTGCYAKELDLIAKIGYKLIKNLF